METKFTIYYDDQLNVVVDKISASLTNFGLTINKHDYGDGYMEYEIVKIEE